MDLTSYGSSLAILNQFVDDDVVKVFEVSPTGQASFLILTTQSLVDAEILESQIIKIYKDDILSIELIKNIKSEVVQTYLSQKAPDVKKSIAVFEMDRLSKAFFVANEMMEKNIHLLDFRVVRTQPCNIILTVSADSASQLLEAKSKYFFAKATIISEVQNTLKSYFEIVR